MSQEFKSLIAPEEIQWIQEKASTRGTFHNALGFLSQVRKSDKNLSEIYQNAIETTSEENHPNFERAFNLLKANATRFGLTEFTSTE